MNNTFNKKPKPAPNVLQEQELFGNTYVLIKSVEASQNVINYTIYRDNDEMVSCSLSIKHHIKDKEKSFLNDYTELDDAMARSMFRHLKRNMLVLQNNLQLRRIKFDTQIAKEKAKKSK